MPKLLRKDALWPHFRAAQLEFVVDNETLAGLANVELSLSTATYQQSIGRIRHCLRRVFTKTFAPKAGYLNPVEWRPRE